MAGIGERGATKARSQNLSLPRWSIWAWEAGGGDRERSNEGKACNERRLGGRSGRG